MKAPETADVALLLEGTYPFVHGGVSSWVQEIVTNLPDVTFSLVFLGGARAQYGEPAYPMPKNVIHFTAHYLLDENKAQRPRACPGHAQAFADSAAFHEKLRDRSQPVPKELVRKAAVAAGTREGVTLEEFLGSDLAWQEISAQYRARCTDPSFVEYFWTVRAMHAPLFGLGQLARQLPPARVYHAISTGYAGYLGMVLHELTGNPLLLSEHGIYTKERKIDLAHAPWIRDAQGAEGELGYLRNLWIRFFEGLGRLTYNAAHPIVSLYEGNRQRQIDDGAPPARTRVVPNGIDVARFAALRAPRPAKPPPVLGLLGRVVPIKDVRTFVRSLRTVCDRIPEAEGWVIGPTSEDESYARECRELARALGLGDKLRFLGFQRPEDVLPKLGLLVLTSISEALPLVVLEAFASGLPVVATDVGACRELIEGREGEDRALGTAGAVVPIADPQATGRACLALLEEEGRWARAQASGIARVERFYTRAQMLESYRALYREAAEWRASASS
ncbi:MAG: GT4 family glycosyltransferase PelF [Myxococcales bacterium]